MPHVIVKARPRKSEEQKRRLAEVITRGVLDALGYGEASVHVGFEEIPFERRKDDDDRPDVEERSETLRTKSGYGM